DQIRVDRHADPEGTRVGQLDPYAIAPRDGIALRRDLAYDAVENTIGNGIGPQHDLLAHTDPRDVFLIHFGGNAKRCAARKMENGLAGGNVLANLTIAADDRPIRRRCESHEVPLRLGAFERGFGGIEICTGAIQLTLGHKALPDEI